MALKVFIFTIRTDSACSNSTKMGLARWTFIEDERLEMGLLKMALDVFKTSDWLCLQWFNLNGITEDEKCSSVCIFA